MARTWQLGTTTRTARRKARRSPSARWRRAVRQRARRGGHRPLRRRGVYSSVTEIAEAIRGRWVDQRVMLEELERLLPRGRDAHRQEAGPRRPPRAAIGVCLDSGRASSPRPRAIIPTSPLAGAMPRSRCRPRRSKVCTRTTSSWRRSSTACRRTSAGLHSARARTCGSRHRLQPAEAHREELPARDPAAMRPCPGR